MSVDFGGASHELQFEVTQKPPVFALTVPVTIVFDNGAARTTNLRLSAQRQEFRFLLDARPARVVLDENYDVFRRLTPAEVPPRIDTLLTRQHLTLLAPPGEAEKFTARIEAFELEGVPLARHGWTVGAESREQPPGIPFRPPSWAKGRSTNGWRQWQVQRGAADAVGTESAATSLILLGEHHPLIEKLFGPVRLPAGGFTVTVLKHPHSPGDVVAIFTATSRAEVDAAFATLFDRRRYSTAAFDDGRLIDYELRAGQRGIAADVQ